MKLFNPKLNKYVAVLLANCMSLPSYAAFGLINVPPQAVVPPIPNVIVTFDDSGSMQSTVPYFSDVVYAIPPNADGLPRGNAGGQPFAYSDGYDDPQNAAGNIVNLSVNNQGASNATVAFFNGLATTAQKQNYANYYGYYRDRTMSMKGSAMLAFSPAVVPEGRMRVAWQTLNNGCNSFTNGAGCTNNRLKSLETGHRTNFFSWIKSVGAGGATPLKAAYIRAGDYLTTTGVNGAYAHSPGVTENPVLECRRSYHVLFTDGGWNEGTNVANSDNTSTVLPDGNNYAVTAPYRGAPGNLGQNGVSDIAFKYWATDLQPTINNGVFPSIKVAGAETYGTTSISQYWNPKNNPATWQHLTLYAIGFGEASNLTPDPFGFTAAQAPTYTTSTTAGPSFAEIVSGTREWPNASHPNIDARAFDLWHAAVNTRGSMFPAKNPDEVISAFRTIVSEILAGNAPTGGASSSLGQPVDFLAVQSGYEGTPSWQGVLSGYGAVNGAVNTVPSFEAHKVLTQQSLSTRVVLTASAPSTGVPFRWASLSPFEQNMLNRSSGSAVDGHGSLRVDYLRGARTQERVPNAVAPAPEFRARNENILGTIANSEPTVIGRPRAGFVDPTYKAFRDANINREKIIYVGANDGMLHGFSGVDGKSKLGYVPRGVYARLSEYTDTTYLHKFYVDGPVIASDAYVDGAWKSFLIGGLGAGGKGFYGLNITDPSTFSEGNAASIVKFDYTAPSEALPTSTPNAVTQFSTESGAGFMGEVNTDLGHIMGDAVRDANVGRATQISKLRNGRWAFITGNGVNSTNERAVLYIVYLDAAGGYQKIIAHPALGQNNGLSAPLPLDIDGNGSVDVIYAGDLKGRLWKFESDAAGVFTVANGGLPLLDVGKPITSSPVVSVHPKGGLMVAFGTGRLMTIPDKTDVATQTIYSVWDKIGVTGTVALNTLVSKTLSVAVPSASGTMVRSLTGPPVNYNTARGWKIDLPIPGERIVFNPLSDGTEALFSTTVPIEGQACSAGAQTGSTIAINMVGGSASPTSTFDINKDGKFDRLDQVNSAPGSVNTVVGFASGLGKLNGILSGGRGKTRNARGSTGSANMRYFTGPGRVAWRDLTP
jgi:type IV pilus assembly protein PilY1